MLMLTTPETIRMIAVALAADLMTNAFGEKAGRLMLEAERTRRDIGGWSEATLALRIEKWLAGMSEATKVKTKE